MPDTMTDPTTDPTTDTTGTTPTAAPVIPNQYTPPPPTTTPDTMTAGVPQTGQPTAPTVMPAGNVPLSTLLNQAAAVHHGRTARALNAVGSILGGDTTYHIVTNPDGSVDATPQPSTPGEKWGRVAKAALMGAAKGFEVGQGPGGAQRAAAAGIETGMAMPQAQQDQTQALAQKANDQNQQKLLFNANIAYLNQRNLEQSWMLGQQKQAASEHEEDRDVQFNKLKADLHMVDVGPAEDVEQAAKIYNGNPQVQQAMTNGNLLIHHSGTQAPHAYIIPEDKLAQYVSSDQTGYRYGVDPTTNNVTKTPYTITANSETGHGASIRMATEQSEYLNAIKVSSQAKLQAAQAAKDRAAANAPPKEEGTWTAGTDTAGNPIERNSKTGAMRPMTQGFLPTGAFDKRMAAHQKEFGSAVDSLNYANDYASTGSPSGTSDEALMEKFFDLAKPSTGFRMTKPQQDMLKQAQDAKDSIVSAARHYLTPEAPYFSPTLRSNIVQTMNEIGKAKGIPIVNGRATLPPLPQSQPTGGGTGGGGIDIPAPIAPPRPGGTINTTLNGKTGTLSATGLFTPDDGSAPTQVPGHGSRPQLPMPKVGDVVAGRTFLGGDPASPSSWR
jgi:hypothetical protein